MSANTPLIQLHPPKLTPQSPALLHNLQERPIPALENRKVPFQKRAHHPRHMRNRQRPMNDLSRTCFPILNGVGAGVRQRVLPRLCPVGVRLAFLEGVGYVQVRREEAWVGGDDGGGHVACGSVDHDAVGAAPPGDFGDGDAVLGPVGAVSTWARCERRWGY